MKLAALALAVSSSAVFAHGQPPAAAHGGQVQDAHGSWVELMVRGDQVEVYVMDEHGGPVPAAQVSGTATVMVGGRRCQVNDDRPHAHAPAPPQACTVAAAQVLIAAARKWSSDRRESR